MNSTEHIVLNTEGHGVMYFPSNKLSEENGLLSLEDLEPLPDQKNDDYSPTCLFPDEERNYLIIMSFSETEKKIRFEKRDS